METVPNPGNFVGKPPHTEAQSPHAVIKPILNLYFIFPYLFYSLFIFMFYLFLLFLLFYFSLVLFYNYFISLFYFIFNWSSFELQPSHFQAIPFEFLFSSPAILPPYQISPILQFTHSSNSNSNPSPAHLPLNSSLQIPNH